jgi:hypothetical protein
VCPSHPMHAPPQWMCIPCSAHAPLSHLLKAPCPLPPHLRQPPSTPPPQSYMAHMTCPYSIQTHPIHGEIYVTASVVVILTNPINPYIRDVNHQYTQLIIIYTLPHHNHFLPFQIKFSKELHTHLESGQPNQLSECQSQPLWTHPLIIHYLQSALL